MAVYDSRKAKGRPAATKAAGRRRSAAQRPSALDAAMAAAGMVYADLERLTGAKRSTVWRWRMNGAPKYVTTIIAQQRRIRALLALLEDPNSPHAA